jgi:hypothetical protein
LEYSQSSWHNKDLLLQRGKENRDRILVGRTFFLLHPRVDFLSHLYRGRCTIEETPVKKQQPTKTLRLNFKIPENCPSPTPNTIPKSLTGKLIPFS